MKQSALIGIGIIVIILVTAAIILQGRINFSGYGSLPSTIPSTSSSASPSETTSATSSASVKSFTVHGYSYGYDPSTITVNKGDTVQINLISDDIGHNICVDGYGVCSDVVSSGGSATLSFTADKAGTFSFYCSVDGHSGLGMQGNLVVQYIS